MLETDPDAALQVLESKEPVPALESKLNALILDPRSTSSQRLQAMLLVSKLTPDHFPWTKASILISNSSIYFPFFPVPRQAYNKPPGTSSLEDQGGRISPPPH